METIDFDRLRPIGFSSHIAQSFAAMAQQDAFPARITEIQRNHVLVHDGEGISIAWPTPPLARELALRPLAVGDWTACRRDEAEVRVVAALPAARQIVRLAPDGTRHVVVAHVDVAFIVMGLDGDFNPRRCERYLALVQAADVWPVVVLTKVDCADGGADRIGSLRARLPAAVAVEALDARSPAAAPQLLPYLAPGQTAVLLGSSGAGKSTLTNTLLGQQVQAIGATRADDGRGRHTTTVRTLHLLPNGACAIDTPGLRGLRPDIDPDDLGASFGDVAALAQACRFRDCRHEEEPGCAVRAAIAPDRLRNYHKLRRDALRDQMSALDRQRQRAEWKARGRAGLERMKMKRAPG